MPDLENAVIDGLQLLLTLRLSGAPAEDTIEKVMDVWILAFRRGRVIDWQEGDGERVRAAFVTVAAHAERWPTPSQVLDRLPPRPERPRLPRPVRPMPPEVRAQLDALMARLLINDRPRAATPNEAEWPELQERLERQRMAMRRGLKPAPTPTGDDHA